MMHASISQRSESENKVIELSSLNKDFGSHRVLNNVDLTLARGEFVALLGENGTGKTTLMSVIMGLIPANSGRLSVLGHQPGSLAAKQRMGVMLQASALPEKLTVKEQVSLFASYYPNAKGVDDVLAIALLTELQNTRIGVLSGGQKQRVLFAMAIIGQPDLLLLDEPTVGLDAASRREFWQCLHQLHQQGTSIVLTTHYLEEAEALAERVVLLSEGRVIADSPIEEFKRSVGGAKVCFQSDASLERLKNLLPHNRFQPFGKLIEMMSVTPAQDISELVNQQIELKELTVNQRSLEDVMRLKHPHTLTDAGSKKMPSPVTETKGATL